MTKNRTFQMRCDQKFLDTLDDISRGMGLSKSLTIEVIVNFYPELVKLQLKLERMIQEAKDQLE
jgi:hypothetical protein